MESVDDVAAAILVECERQYPGEPVTTMKLQKLAYYGQAQHLVEFDAPLFDEPIRAWVDGPVIRRLFDQHRGRAKVRQWPSGKVGRLSARSRSLIGTVVARFGGHTAEQLRAMTHREQPWWEARGSLAPDARSDREIPVSTIRDFHAMVAERGAAAATFAVESTRLEGRSLGSDAAAELEDVAAGTRSGDDAVAALLSSHRRPS